MSFGLESAMGVPLASVEDLLRGHVSSSIAIRLGTVTSAIQDFINGRVGIAMAQVLGTTAANGQNFRNRISREGAIGVVIGLCIARTRCG